MNQKTIIIAVVIILSIFGYNAARTEYQRIQARIETTQAKIDKLADETGAMVDILAESIDDVRKTIKSITDRFTKAIDEKGMQLEESFRSEVYRLESKPTIIEHPKQEPTVFEPPKQQPTIIMHSGYSCGPCNAWIATEQSKWEMVGWRIEVVKEVSSTRGWPWYAITDRNGKRFEVDGPLTNDAFYASQKVSQ